MDTAKKAKYGSIQLVERSGKLYLHFRANGKRFRFSLGITDTSIGRKKAESIAYKIEVDILSGNFDPTLEKYSSKPKIILEKTTSVLEMWQKWVKSLRLSKRTENGHYKAIEAMITRWGKVKLDQIPEKLQSEKLSSVTFNQRLSYLKRFLNWCREEKLIEVNPLIKVKPRKESRSKAKRKPFSTNEVQRILEAFRTDSCCNPKSAYKHSQYYPFVKFLFLTGCRISEAIGIRVRDVDLETGEIEISSTLARSDTGLTSGKQRVRKPTKTENIRYLRMNESLKELVSTAIAGKKPDDLLFTSPKGNPIDDHSFSQRIWKPVLLVLGLEYRVPYAGRHTLATRAIEAGMPINQVSYILGHSDVQTTLSFYTHKSKPAEMPDLF
jgi:integrase